jgi:hypothetical protein
VGGALDTVVGMFLGGGCHGTMFEQTVGCTDTLGTPGRTTRNVRGALHGGRNRPVPSASRRVAKVPSSVTTGARMRAAFRSPGREILAALSGIGGREDPAVSTGRREVR